MLFPAPCSPVFMRTRIKFCGMTRPGDVRLAAELGADAVGLVFAARSPRRLDLRQALALREAAPPLLAVVALFMDNESDQVERVVAALRPHVLQFHGAEPESFCLRFGLPYIKAVPMAAADPERAAGETLRAHPRAGGFILDAHAPGAPGGRGHRFDWSRIPELPRPWLLAGGLRPDNVAEAIGRARPWGVDVSSGIERAPGIKDGAAMERFVNEVHRADCRRIDR